MDKVLHTQKTISLKQNKQWKNVNNNRRTQTQLAILIRIWAWPESQALMGHILSGIQPYGQDSTKAETNRVTVIIEWLESGRTWSVSDITISSPSITSSQAELGLRCPTK